MAIDFLALKNECINNPNNYSDPTTGLTLTQAWVGGFDQVCVNILNRVRNSITIGRSDVAPSEVIEAIAINQFVSNVPVIHASWFESFSQLPAVRLVSVDANGVSTDSQVMKNLMLLLANQSASENRLRALATRKGSRTEQLFGEGTVLVPDHIITARSA